MKGHIRQQGKETYAVVIDLGTDPLTGKRQQRWHTVKGGKRDAQRHLAKLVNDLAEGRYVDPVKLTVADYLQRWLQDYARVAVRPTTFQSYGEIIRKHIIPVLGGLPLNKLQPVHVQHFYADKLAGGLSARTVRYIHAILHRALEQAVKWLLLPRNVADAVDPPKAQHKEMRPLDVAEVGRLLDAAAGDRLYALYLLAITTGMRQGELLGLQWPDVDLDAGTIMIRRTLQRTKEGGRVFQEPKTAKSRRLIQLSPQVVEALREHRARQEQERRFWGDRYQDHGLVFSQPAGQPIDKGNLLRRHFKPLLAQAGLPPIRFHDLRHTYATLALQAGLHPKVVQENLGHSTISMTLDTYSHVAPVLQRDAAQVVTNLILKTKRY